MASKKGKNAKPVTEEVKEENVNAEAEEVKEENVSNEETSNEETSNEESVAEEAGAEEATEELGDVSDKAKEKIEELEDKVKRQLAEFDNYRKRTEKEKTQMFEAGASSVIEKILPVVDNFERGLASVPEEEKSNPHVEGMQMIYKQLMAELEKLEVKPIEAVGCEFNPDFHNAIMQVASDEYESGVIAQELQKGYTYRDTVIRHSMVSVVQ